MIVDSDLLWVEGRKCCQSEPVDSKVNFLIFLEYH